MGQSSEGSPSFWKEWQFCKPSSISEGMVSQAGLTSRSSTHSALCTFFGARKLLCGLWWQGPGCCWWLGQFPLPLWASEAVRSPAGRAVLGHMWGTRKDPALALRQTTGYRVGTWTALLACIRGLKQPCGHIPHLHEFCDSCLEEVILLVAFLMLNDHVQGSSCSGHTNTGQAFSGALEGLWSSSPSGRWAESMEDIFFFLV